MILRLRRALARAYWTRIERGWKLEVARLELERATWGERMDKALRNVSAAACNRTFLDIRRPPITHAPGAGPRDGVQRFSLLGDRQ